MSLPPPVLLSVSPPLLVQHQRPNKSCSRRKAWYERAMEVSRLWKALRKPPKIIIPIKNTIIKPTTSAETDTRPRKLGKSSSTTRVASSFTRACLCAPISSYTNVFHNDVVVPPTRSRSYRRCTSLPARPKEIRAPMMMKQDRKIFRGKSLTDDVLMRRFVIEEVRRRSTEMEINIIRRRSGIVMNKKKIGPSLLSRMAMANDD